MTPAEREVGHERAGIPSLRAFPGGDLVERGLADRAASRPTAEAALIEVARTRLADRDPEGDVYGTCCAWLDQLVSFLAAFRPER